MAFVIASNYQCIVLQFCVVLVDNLHCEANLLSFEFQSLNLTMFPDQPLYIERELPLDPRRVLHWSTVSKTVVRDELQTCLCYENPLLYSPWSYSSPRGWLLVGKVL